MIDKTKNSELAVLIEALFQEGFADLFKGGTEYQTLDSVLSDRGFKGIRLNITTEDEGNLLDYIDSHHGKVPVRTNHWLYTDVDKSKKIPKNSYGWVVSRDQWPYYEVHVPGKGDGTWELKHFEVVPLEEVPEEVQRLISPAKQGIYR